MPVQAATRTFTDIGGSRGAEGKPSRSRPSAVPGDLLAALSDERHGDPRKVTGSSQRSALHAAGSGRCLHFGKCACKRQLVPSRTSAGLGEQKANQAVRGVARKLWLPSLILIPVALALADHA